MATVTIYYGSNSQAHSEMFSSGGLSKTDSEGNLLCYYTTITQEMLSAHLPQKEGFSFSGFKARAGAATFIRKNRSDEDKCEP